MNWNTLAETVLVGETISKEDALRVLTADNDEILPILNAAYAVRRKFFGKKVKCCMLINAQSGNCSEDCAYCTQSKDSKALIEKFRLVDKDTMVTGSKRYRANKTCNYSIVTSGRGPTDKMLDDICAAIREIKEQEPELQVCASLGMLKPGQAEKLKQAGLDRYHHNINTSRGHHDNIVTTHSFDDRMETVRDVKEHGISTCSGVIIGMGESPKDVVDMAFTLREMNVDSIPINFLMAAEGTALEGTDDLDPQYCLKVLAMFRLVCGDQEIRLAGGRERNLRSMQPLAFYAVNSIFVGEYLTQSGNSTADDHRMIEDAGFEVDF